MNKYDFQQEIDGEFVTLGELEGIDVESYVKQGKPTTLRLEYAPLEEEHELEEYRQSVIDQMQIGKKVRMLASSGDVLIGEVVEFDRETLTAKVGKLERVTPRR